MASTADFDVPQPLLEALVENRWLPLIGAGFSLNAELAAGAAMPTWERLGKELESEVRHLVPGGGPLEAISSYAFEHGRPALVQRLRRALHVGAARAGAAHRAFAHLPFDVVATTNFDDLLEDGYRAVGRRLTPIVREHQLAQGVPRGAVALVKAHGDLDNEPMLVATEDDYDEFLLRRPLLATYLGNLLITRIPVLIGYSLSDPDWRQLLAAVRSRLGDSRQPAYAFEVDPRPQVVRRFERRGVIVIPLRSRRRPRGDVFAALFRQLRDYVAQHSLDASVVRDEAVREALLGTGRPLVLFGVPERLLAFYRGQVFPEVRAAGFAPVTGHDVDPAGGSLDAAVLGLLRRAAAVIVDTTDGDQTFEAFLAAGAFLDARTPLAIVAGNRGAPPVAGDAEPAVLRIETLEDPTLAALLLDWLSDAVPAPATPIDDEPGWQVVLTPSARVIMAFNRLESAARRRHGQDVPLARVVADLNLPATVDVQLRVGIAARNLLLHAHRTSPITETEASSFERAVEHAVAALEG